MSIVQCTCVHCNQSTTILNTWLQLHYMQCTVWHREHIHNRIVRWCPLQRRARCNGELYCKEKLDRRDFYGFPVPRSGLLPLLLVCYCEKVEDLAETVNSKTSPRHLLTIVEYKEVWWLSVWIRCTYMHPHNVTDERDQSKEWHLLKFCYTLLSHRHTLSGG